MRNMLLHLNLNCVNFGSQALIACTTGNDNVSIGYLASKRDYLLAGLTLLFGTAQISQATSDSEYFYWWTVFGTGGTSN